MLSITQDVRYALRKLIQRPGFTIAAVLILALGVSANTTIFSIVNTVLLSPLPYDRSNDLVVVKESNPTKSIEQNDVSPGSFLDLRGQTSIFESVTAWYETASTLQGERDAEQIASAQVSVDFFKVFNVQPALGRVFLPHETAGAAFENSRFVSGDRVVVISDGLWRRRFGSDPNIAGKKININRNEWEVLGVMPANFAVSEKETELWLPWDIARTYSTARFPQGPPRDWRFMNVVGRLNPSISRDEGQARLSTFYNNLADRYPATNQSWNAVTIPLYEETVQSNRLILLVLLGAVGMVLLLAAANIAGLVLANATSRQREFALRLALGASRFRLIRQLLAESLLLAAAGGLIGVGVSWIGLDLLLSLAPQDLPRISQVVIDWRVLLFAFGLSLTAAIVFGLIPALRSTGVALSLNLRDGGTKGFGGRLPNRRFRNAMVIAQVSVALVLITCAGLLVRSFNHIVSVNPGFEPSNLLTMHITLDGAVYGRSSADYYRELIKRLQTMPSVVSAAAVSTLPMSDVGVDFTRPYWRAGEVEPSGDGDKVAVRMATPEYFKTMGITLLQGRNFTDQDRRETTAVIVVNKSLADKTWPNENPIGKRLMLDYNRGKYAYEVVGVSDGLRYYGLKKDPAPELFIPHAQNAYLPMNVVVKTKSDPNLLVEAVKREASALDPTQPVSNLRTMDYLVQRSFAKDRFSARLLSVLASLALVLAATGLYSLLSYFVSQRRHELAVRVAVGAQRSDIVRLVLGQGALVVIAGIVLGLLGSFVAGRFLSSLLFGVGPTDFLTFVTTPLLLAAVALFACYFPAWRATTVDPLAALRSE